MTLDITIDDREEATPIATRRGLRIDAVHLGHVLAGGRRILDDISLTIEPGQLVAIAGASGAGKSTLLDTLAGLRQPSSGSVRLVGMDDDKPLGYVPQDDIIHRDLPLRTTLRYAAQLRLPAATPGHVIESLIDDTLETLGLTERADVPVGRLSGGQRKRASIGVELLTRPHVLFLDEPTSGLDPATANGLVRMLRRLADDGTTVVLTTHNTDDLRLCDRVIFLARGGRLAFDGPLDAAIVHFHVDDVGEIYDQLAPTDDRNHRVEPRRDRDERAAATLSPQARSTSNTPPGAWRQWAILTRRNVDAIAHNRLTLAITIGSPVAVIAMLAILFESGTFDGNRPDPTTGAMVSFWIAFAAFFFGLTFGLLQICTELAILRRERFVGLNLGSYLLAKLAVLVPALLGVIVLMVAVLTALHRLPTMDAGEIAMLIVTLLLDAIAATALGLLASAAVADPSQATLALPMLCFPAVLFSGAVVSTATMTAPGRAISTVTSNRWAFEVVRSQLVGPMSGGGRHAEVLTGAVGGHWAVLAAFTAVFLAAAHTVLRQRSVAATSTRR